MKLPEARTDRELPHEQYRCLVAHMMYWKWGLRAAMNDCLITISEHEVISELDKAGWSYDPHSDSVTFDG